MKFHTASLEPSHLQMYLIVQISLVKLILKK